MSDLIQSGQMDAIQEKAFITGMIACDYPGCEQSFDTFESDPPRDPMESWSLNFVETARAAGWTTNLAGNILCPEHGEG